MIRKSSTLLSTLALFLTFCAGTGYASIIYVNTGGSDSNTGQSWSAAKKTVQAGIDTTSSGDQVWVSRGTYVESIVLKDGVALYGGFQGTEKKLEERPAFPRGDDDPNASILDGNQADHVILATSLASQDNRVDGFIIQNGGRFNGVYLPSTNGGGILCDKSSLFITNNTFRGNIANNGGAIYCEASSPSIIQNRFTWWNGGGNDHTINSANHGGSICCLSLSNPQITSNKVESLGDIYCNNSSPIISENDLIGSISCEANAHPLITRNNIGSFASAVYCVNSSPTISYNNIGSISSDSWGSRGIYCISSSPTITHNTIQHCHDVGIYCEAGSAPEITFNSITDNTFSSGTSAAGIHCSSSNPTIAYNIISNNTANAGAAICCVKSSPVISNNIMTGNKTNQRGSVFSGSPDSAPTFTNNVIVGNTAPSNGAALAFGGNTKIYNNIIAFNSGGIFKGPVAVPDIRNNCVYNPGGVNYSGLSAGTGDISLDPLLADKDNGNYHLTSNSPCINTGWSDAVTSLTPMDMDGDDRVNGTVDMGVDEWWDLSPVSAAKSAGDDTTLAMHGAVITGVFRGCFYIENDNRSGGIRVETTGDLPSIGDKVNIMGKAMTNADGERCLAASRVSPTGTGSITPLALTNRALGGGTLGHQAAVWGWQLVKNPDTDKYERVWQESKGLNNIGLLVKTCGKVTREGTDTFISDGSDASVKLILPSRVSIDESWQYISVTGISSCEKVDGELVRVLRVRAQDDIKRIN